ncbi:hypothetical protein PMAYCL1PPCAC_24684, partial [Pristionchus mayeri]
KWQFNSYDEITAADAVSCKSKRSIELQRIQTEIYLKESERNRMTFIIFFVGGWLLFVAALIIFVVCCVVNDGCGGGACRRCSCSRCACCR